MQKKILFNGDLIIENEIGNSFLNRSFLYGDGFFETILVQQKSIPFLQYHFDRICKSFAVLDFQQPLNFTFETFKTELELLIAANQLINAKIRMAFYRNGTTGYLPLDNSFSYYAKINELKLTAKSSLSATIYFNNKKALGAISNLKSSSALIYVMAAQYANSKGFDEAIVLNSNGFVADTTNSNIFIFKNNKLITPPLTDGGVDGVCRKFIIQKFSVIEKSIGINELINADEIFLTNAVKLIQPINKVDEKIFSTTQSDNFAQQIIELIK
jgi:branched-chain amino acid aminotransferase